MHTVLLLRRSSSSLASLPRQFTIALSIAGSPSHHPLPAPSRNVRRTASVAAKFLWYDFTIAEPTWQDSLRQVLCPPWGLREAQARVWGSPPFAWFFSCSLFLGAKLAFCLAVKYVFSCVRGLMDFQVHQLVVNRDPKFTNFIEVRNFRSFLSQIC